MPREGTRGANARKKTPKGGDDEKASSAARSTAAATDSDDGKALTPSNVEQHQHHPLMRVAEGMNRRSLLTGYYGARGERIRHVVSTGALSMPKEALDIMAAFEDRNTPESETTTSKPTSKATAKKRKASLQLPGLDSVVRPTKDKSLKTIIVTDISRRAFPNSADPSQPSTIRTFANNRVVHRAQSSRKVVLVSVGEPERIRGGGGGGDEKQDQQDSNASQPDPSKGNASQITNATNTSNTVNKEDETSKVAAQGGLKASEEATKPTKPETSTEASADASQCTTEPPIEETTTAANSNQNASTPAPVPSPSAVPDSSKSASSSLASDKTPSGSSATAPAEAATSKVIPLAQKQRPHWKQHVPSSSEENLIDVQAKNPKPHWYVPNKASSLERTLLPEWFDGSASHRTEETFLKARETMIHISNQLGNRFVTSTLARRSLPGDVGSIHRLHTFLTHYLWINEEAKNDSAPTAPSLQSPPQLTASAASMWTNKRRGELVNAVVVEVSQSNKKQKTEQDDPMEIETHDHVRDRGFLAVDWDSVAETVGASPYECEREFLAMPLDETSVAAENDRPITPDTLASHSGKANNSSQNQEDFIKSLTTETSPAAIRAVTGAALSVAGRDLPEAQRIARLGLVANQAIQIAQAQEETVSRLLSEVIDQRMQKLECRMSLMDDLEGILEAERVTLELERRDFYTTRCREWFSGS